MSKLRKMDWWRSWHGAPTDSKWILFADQAGCSPAIAAAIAWALFDSASQCVTRGHVRDFSARAYAAWARIDVDTVLKVVSAMENEDMIVGGFLSSWSKRQPEREDDSSDRTAAYRERKRLVVRSVT